MRELSIASIGKGFDGSDMGIRKLLANPEGYEVEDSDNYVCPKVGDKIYLTSCDGQYKKKLCSEVSKLLYVTVKEVHPVAVRFGNKGYVWMYDVSIKEADLRFNQFHYKIIS